MSTGRGGTARPDEGLGRASEAALAAALADRAAHRPTAIARLREAARLAPDAPRRADAERALEDTAAHLEDLLLARMPRGAPEDPGPVAALGDGTWVLPARLLALCAAERLDEAEALAGEVAAVARARSAAAELLVADGFRAVVLARRGRLDAAEGFLRACIDVAQRGGGLVVAVVALVHAVDVLVERSAAAPARALLADPALTIAVQETGLVPLLQASQGLVLLAEAERMPAAVALEEALPRLQAAGAAASGPVDWRCPLALAVARDDPTRAERLAREALADAQAARSARGEGVARRVLGLVAPALRAAELGRSAALLERADHQLDLARTLLELGAHERRRGERAEARQVLRRALDLADRCGAERLCAHVRDELRACGARPRRARESGVEALTPSELRVARLAAQGRSNREIADTLVISVRTVEMHLGRTYAKLGIGSRGGLGAALEGDSAPVDGDGAPANAGWIVVAPGSPRERTVPIVGRILIGRECAGLAPPRSLVLDEPRVSRDHLEVVIDGTRGPFLVDRSTNGTWLNDERVERGAPTPMRDGDRIRLGAAVELVFRAPLGPGAPVGPAAETQRAED